MPRPRVEKERTEQIIQAALTVFAGKGFHPTRMEDIAKECGLSKGTLYLYFKSKDDIIQAILELFFEQEFLNHEKLLEDEGTVTKRLLQWVKQVVNATLEMTAMMSIGYELYALAARQENVRQHLKKYYESYSDLLAQFIQQGIERGEFESGTNTLEVAMMIVALLEGFNLLLLTTIEIKDPGIVIEKGIQALLLSIQQDG